VRSDPIGHTAARVYVFATIDHVDSPACSARRGGAQCQAGCASPRGPNAPRAVWSVIRI